MDDKFLSYYEHELDLLRHASGRFAEEFPKIAKRLQISGQECADPYVERLLEGTAFLTARIARKLDDGQQEFPEALLDQMAPGYNMPLVSRGIIRLRPGKPVELPAGTLFTVPTTLPDASPCTYALREPLCSSGLLVTESEYVELPELPVKPAGVCGALRWRVACTAAAGAGPVRFFVNMPPSAAGELLQLLLTECAGVVACHGGRVRELPAAAPEECRLPDTPQGLPHVAEFFLMAEQAAFITIRGLREALPENGEAELYLMLRRGPTERLRTLLHGAESVLTDCARVINAFPKRLSRITPSWREYEHAVADATAAADYEVLQIFKGSAYSVDNAKLFDIYPFYYADDAALPEDNTRLNYFSMRREQPVAPPRKRLSPYRGAEAYLQVSGPEYTAMRDMVHSYALEALCSNRDLPLFLRKDVPLSAGELKADFVVAPTPPQEPLMQDAARWMGLALARLAPGMLAGYAPQELPVLLRNLLSHLHRADNRAALRYVSGITAVQLRSCSRTVPVQGDLCVMRGWHYDIRLNEEAFGGIGVFLFAAALAADLLRLGEINTFSEVAVHTTEQHLNTWRQQ